MIKYLESENIGGRKDTIASPSDPQDPRLWLKTNMTYIRNPC